MKRFILVALAAAMFTTTATAGPLRNWLASRRPCQPQPAPVATYSAPPVQYATYAAPAYQPGPVQQFAGNVLVGTGQVIQAAGQVVQAYQPAGFSPVVRTCNNGTCR